MIIVKLGFLHLAGKDGPQVGLSSAGTGSRWRSAHSDTDVQGHSTRTELTLFK